MHTARRDLEVLMRVNRMRRDQAQDAAVDSFQKTNRAMRTVNDALDMLGKQE
jgi:hypothetical protein